VNAERNFGGNLKLSETSLEKREFGVDLDKEQ
jgi:hypothetical protein